MKTFDDAVKVTVVSLFYLPLCGLTVFSAVYVTYNIYANVILPGSQSGLYKKADVIVSETLVTKREKM